jgi:hypothetical protein
MRFLFCLITAVADAIASNKPVVEVFLPPVLGMNQELAFDRARIVVTGIYSEIGVGVIWRSAVSAPPGCSKKPLHRQIVVNLAADTPRGVGDGVFAYSNPYAAVGPCVTLLANRFEYGLFTNPTTTGVLVGHALAHEIGHVLEGISRHSETGLMKERWSPNEVRGMRDRWLHFEDYDKRLILEGLGIFESPQTRDTENPHHKASVSASAPSARVRDEEEEIRRTPGHRIGARLITESKRRRKSVT